MTDTQIVTMAIVLLAALASVMFNNMRISDLRTDLNARFGELRDSVNQHIDDKYKLVDAKLDRIIDMLASHDERITKLGG